MQPTPERLPLRRPKQGRVFGGVCAGLALHLSWSVAAVRVAMVGLMLMAGAGILFYVWLWITVPSGDPYQAAHEDRPAKVSRLAPMLPRIDVSTDDLDDGSETSRKARRVPWTDLALGGILLVIAGLVVATRLGFQIETTWVLPVIVTILGLAVAWSQLAARERSWVLGHATGRTPRGLVRVAAGVAMTTVGILMLFGHEVAPSVLMQGGVAALAVVVGIIVALAPWLLRLVRELQTEREARARESERADIAAHLHDSVLQSLTLIRKRASDPEFVSRIARAQERELREWLYADRPLAGTSVAEELRSTAAEVEDVHGVPIDVVVVGDAVPNEDMTAMLMATREALLNAVVHGKPPVSAYLEVGADEVQIFVRDRGEGFDLAAIPEDRLGVRESVIGRVTRRGGRARVRSNARGLEIELTMPWRGEPTAKENNG